MWQKAKIILLSVVHQGVRQGAARGEARRRSAKKWNEKVGAEGFEPSTSSV
jgi:hypothetical protein